MGVQLMIGVNMKDDNKVVGCDCCSIHHEKMKKGKAGIEGVGNYDVLATFFKTFGDITRLKIMVALDCVGEMCVCDIAVALNMTKSAISHQLKYLKSNDLIKSVKVGKTVFYSIIDNHVKSVLEMGIEHVSHKRVGL